MNIFAENDSKFFFSLRSVTTSSLWTITRSLEKFVACVSRVKQKDTLYLCFFGRADGEVLTWKYSIMSDFLAIPPPVIGLMLGNFRPNTRRRKRGIGGELWLHTLLRQDPLVFPQAPFILRSENILVPQATPIAVHNLLITTSVKNAKKEPSFAGDSTMKDTDVEVSVDKEQCPI